MALTGMGFFMQCLPLEPRPAHVVAATAQDPEFIAHIRAELVEALRCTPGLFERCEITDQGRGVCDFGLSPEDAQIAATNLIVAARLGETVQGLPPQEQRIKALRAAPEFLNAAWIAANEAARNSRGPNIPITSPDVTALALAASVTHIRGQ